MREKAPEAYPRDQTKRTVRLFCEDRKTLWLCVEDAEWAARYLRDQLDTKGVTHVPDDDIGPGGPPHSCHPQSAVPLDNESILAIEDGSLAKSV